MFASGNFGSPPPRIPLYNNRIIGALLLVVAVIFCLIMVLGLDSAVFIPHNATEAVTQTWQAQHPATATPSASTRVPRRTPTVPGDFDLQASADKP